MTDPRLVTASQAADPTIPLQLLADIAARRPDLRAVVAANPAAYPALLDWLGSLGDAAVDGALRARATQGAAQGHLGHNGLTGFASRTDVGGLGTGGSGPGGPGVAGSGPSRPEVGRIDLGEHDLGDRDRGKHGDQSVSSRIAQYAGGFAPLGGAGRAVPEPAAPYLPVPRPVPYTQPDGAYYPPTGSPTSPPTSPPTSAVTGPGAGTRSGYPAGGVSGSITPFGHTAPPYGAPAPWQVPSKSSNKALWIALAVIGVLFVAAIGLVVVVGVTASNAAGYGDDATMDALHDACAAGDMSACDTLFVESPWGSEYEDFGNTCGGRTDGTRYCTEESFG